MGVFLIPHSMRTWRIFSVSANAIQRGVTDDTGIVENLLPVKATLDMGGENDIAVVGFGANDAAQKLDKDVFRAKTRQVLEYLNAFAGKSLIITPIPAMVELEERREEYCQIIREEHRNCSRVTLLEGFSFFPAGKEELYADKLHPNDEGMKIYAEGLIKAIRSL